MRVTLDTGILVRMNVKARGSAKRLLETLLNGPHDLVLSEFLLNETARVLGYPRLQKIYQLTPQDIAEHVELLRRRAELVSAVVYEPVVLSDPNDDPVVYTAVAGRVDVLCAKDRDFYEQTVVSFCRGRGIEILDDVALLRLLESKPPPAP
jgi:putative PIN family toxin of toxin-antitoxin system